MKLPDFDEVAIFYLGRF